MNTIRLVTTFAAAFCLAGCANLWSVHRSFSTEDGSGALIDIKQRAILVSRDKYFEDRYVTCAEPSPDSLSAYAAELAASANLPKGGGQLASGFNEGAAYTGLRTQSIQLLRDSFFRICEAYMNGAITPAQYELLTRRYQKHTVALLAVEQLTGTIRPPAIVITTEVEGKSSPIESLLKKLSTNKVSIIEKEKERKTLQDQIDAFPEGADKEAATKEKADAVEKIDADLVRLTKENETLQAAIAEGGGGSIKGSSKAQIESQVSTSNKEIESKESFIAQAVLRIVEGVTLTDDFMQICMVYFNDTMHLDRPHWRQTVNKRKLNEAEAKRSERISWLDTACGNRFHAANEFLNSRGDIIKTQMEIIENTTLPMSEKVESIKLLNNILLSISQVGEGRTVDGTKRENSKPSSQEGQASNGSVEGLPGMLSGMTMRSLQDVQKALEAAKKKNLNNKP